MKFLDERLQKLKALFAAMGGCAEQMIKEAGAIIFQKGADRDSLYALIRGREMETDRLQIKIEKFCFRVLAMQAPVAKDLRLILFVLRGNTYLERMGDLSLSIAKKGRGLKEDPLLESPLKFLEEMFHHVSAMAKGSLDAFINEDESLAREIIMQDDRADELKSAACAEFKECILKNGGLIDTCIQLVGVAEKLERVGDQATNIAEEVIFLQTGRNIKHQKI